MYTDSSLPSPVAQRYRALLPPQAVGVVALACLARTARGDELAGRLSRDQACELLLMSYFGSVEQLCGALCGSVDLPPEDAEDVIQVVGLRLGDLYGGWRGDGKNPDSFGAYLHRTLVREARRLSRRVREEGERRREVGPTSPPSTPAPARLVELQQQALRRYVWYLYGSPDNHARLCHDKAFADYLALMTRLQERSFAWLVDECQPRPGAWGPRQGEDPAHWWRNRATLAWRGLKDSLRVPENWRVYLQICRELGLEPV